MSDSNKSANVPRADILSYLRLLREETKDEGVRAGICLAIAAVEHWGAPGFPSAELLGNTTWTSEARRERIIATARRAFEAWPTEEQYASARARSTLTIAAAFEDAADKFRNEATS